MAKKFAFSLKEVVVYPGQGVGTIQEITKRQIYDEEIDYYVIYLEESDMTVLVPIDGVERLGIRRIITKTEAEKVLEFLSENFTPIPVDWKARYQMNLDLFKSAKIFDTASVVRSLYKRSKAKELPIQERKLYDAAYRIFKDEIAAALKLSAAEAEELIHSSLEPFGSTESSDDYDSAFDDDDFDNSFDDENENEDYDDDDEDDDD